MLLNKRMQLEKKYSNYCLYFKIPLPERGNKILSISPSGYFYHTGINANIIDSEKYKQISKKAHFGLRLKIEKEVSKIINLNLFEGYFFDKKNKLYSYNLDQLNSFLIKNNNKPLKIYEFNRLKKLFRKWNEESVKCHYQIKGAKRRIHNKIKKEGIKCTN